MQQGKCGNVLPEMSCRLRATRRSRVGTPYRTPVPTSPVPTRLRRVAHSNGRAIRPGSRAALDGGSTAARGQPVVAGLVLRHPYRLMPVPTRLRRVAHSNGRAIRPGSRAALDGGSAAACGQPVVAGLVLRHPSLRAPVIRRKSFSAVSQGSSRAIPSSQQPARPSLNSAQCTAPRRQTCQHHATNGRTGLEPRTGPDVPEDD